jgi:omega-amidase
MQDLNVTIIQSELHWENIDANLAMFEEKIWLIKVKTDLIVLPEMFTTGFTMNAHSLAEPMNSKTFKWMRQMSEQTGAAITGSFIVRDKNKLYNRLLWITPDGDYKYYDKRHLFRMARENETFSEGRERVIVEWRGWRILPLICYDLRFPVFSRLGKDLGYDCLIYVANWPEKRRLAWNTLIKARAIENLSYTIAVNRVGLDGNGHSYLGDSSVILPDGSTLFTQEAREVIETVTLKAELLKTFRRDFPAYLDADEYYIK